MKNLIFINGTMGVGKTTTAKNLQQILPNCVFLDGDWCWDSHPFTVTEETKRMVLKNISYLLNNFLNCSAYENIIFCWVMHEESIYKEILDSLNSDDYKFHIFSLTCSREALISRLSKDIYSCIRDNDIIERSIPRLENYLDMDTEKIDVSDITAIQAAELISKKI